MRDEEQEDLADDLEEPDAPAEDHPDPIPTPEGESPDLAEDHQ